MPQIVRAPFAAFSAALIAYVEVHGGDDANKNRLCVPVPFPHCPEDYPRTLLGNIANQMRWSVDKPLQAWIKGSRLDGFGRLARGIDRDDAAKIAVLGRLRQSTGAAMVNLTRLADTPVCLNTRDAVWAQAPVQPRAREKIRLQPVEC